MLFTIVVAWLDEGMVHDGRPFAADLGARPNMRVQVQAKAAMWLNKGTEADIEKARAHVAKEHPDNGRVYAYAFTWSAGKMAGPKDPLKQAREDVLMGRAGR